MSTSSLASASSKDDVSSSGISNGSSSSSSSKNCNGINGSGGGGDELHTWNGSDDETGDKVGRCSPIVLGSCGGQGGGENSGAMTRLSSLDCWDYTIELECLRGGPEGYYYLMFLYLLSIV